MIAGLITKKMPFIPLPRVLAKWRSNLIRPRFMNAIDTAVRHAIIHDIGWVPSDRRSPR